MGGDEGDKGVWRASVSGVRFRDDENERASLRPRQIAGSISRGRNASELTNLLAKSLDLLLREQLAVHKAVDVCVHRGRVGERQYILLPHDRAASTICSSSRQSLRRAPRQRNDAFLSEGLEPWKVFPQRLCVCARTTRSTRADPFRGASEGKGRAFLLRLPTVAISAMQPPLRFLRLLPWPPAMWIHAKTSLRFCPKTSATPATNKNRLRSPSELKTGFPLEKSRGRERSKFEMVLLGLLGRRPPRQAPGRDR